MFALVVSLRIKPGTVAAFQETVKRQATMTFNEEPGCRRFDAVQSTTDEHHWLLYEIYDDEVAFESHRTTAHFREWRAAVGELVEHQVNTSGSIFVSNGE